jgi:hypothetical protein
MKIRTDRQLSRWTGTLLRAAIASAFAVLPLAAGTIAFTTMNVAHTNIPGGFHVTDGSNNGLFWTDLSLLFDGQDTLNLTGVFTCTNTGPCVSTTIKFNFTGSGFGIGQTQLGSLMGTTTGTYNGNFNYSNSAVNAVSTVVTANAVNGPFDVLGNPGDLTAGSFTGQGNFYVASVPGGTVLKLSGTGAQIQFINAPEPATAGIMAAGLLLLFLSRRSLLKAVRADVKR